MSQLLLLFLCCGALAGTQVKKVTYHDQSSRVIWVKCVDNAFPWFNHNVYINNVKELIECHQALNHFYDRGYEIVGHSLTSTATDIERVIVYSWTLSRVRVKEDWSL